MYGITEDILDNLIDINNLNSESVNINIKDIIQAINSFEKCYSGKSLDFIFNYFYEQISNINKISQIIMNYSEILKDVKTSYLMQDLNIYNSINKNPQ